MQLQQLRQKVMMELRLKANDGNTYTKLYEIATKFRKNRHVHSDCISTGTRTNGHESDTRPWTKTVVTSDE